MGEFVRLAVTFASGTTASAEVDLGRVYSRVHVELPSATTFNLNLQAAGSLSGSYHRVYNSPGDNDAVVTAWEITSATAGTNGAMVPIPSHLIGRYMKLESQTAVADGKTYYFCCYE